MKISKNMTVAATQGLVEDNSLQKLHGSQNSDSGKTMNARNKEVLVGSIHHSEEAPEDVVFVLQHDIEVFAPDERYALVTVQGQQSNSQVIFVSYDEDFQTKPFCNFPTAQSFGSVDLSNPTTVNALMISLNHVAEIGLPCIKVFIWNFWEEELISHIFAGMTYEHDYSDITFTLDEKTKEVLAKRTSELTIKVLDSNTK